MARNLAAIRGLGQAEKVALGDLDRRISPTAWKGVTFAGTWVNSASWQTVQYRKVGDMVQLRGTCNGGAAVSGSGIFNLPVGFRPPAMLSLGTEGNGNFKWCLVAANGDVNWYCPATDAASTSSFHFNHQFSITP